MRPLQDTLKITESMTNLLSDEDNNNGNRPVREADSESPLPIEGNLFLQIITVAIQFYFISIIHS